MKDHPQQRIDSLAALEERHTPCRRRLGLADRDDAVIRRVAELFAVPAWVRPGISLGDALFLYDLVRAVRPARAVELGVAAGCSSALFLGALADIHGLNGPNAPLLVSADIHSECHFDRTRPVGRATAEMVPHLTHLWRLHTGATAADLPHLLSRYRSRQLHLAFIDADHRHPAPIADIAALLPCLAPGAWITLNGIAQPDSAARMRTEGGSTGPRLLFEHWPFEKLCAARHGDRPTSSHTGAIRLPADAMTQAEFIAAVAPALAAPWQTPGGPGLSRLLDVERLAA